MPSRKKAQGKARKAKQAAKAKAQNQDDVAASSCDHLGERASWSQTDFNAAKNLCDKFVLQYCAHGGTSNGFLTLQFLSVKLLIVLSHFQFLQTQIYRLIRISFIILIRFFTVITNRRKLQHGLKLE